MTDLQRHVAPGLVDVFLTAHESRVVRIRVVARERLEIVFMLLTQMQSRGLYGVHRCCTEKRPSTLQDTLRLRETRAAALSSHASSVGNW